MSIPEDDITRLEALKREPLRGPQGLPAEVEALRRKLRAAAPSRPAAAPAGTAQPIVYRRDLPRSPGRPAEEPDAPRPIIPLHEAVPGAEVEVGGGGKAYVVTRRLGGPDGKPHRLATPFRVNLADPGSRMRRLLASRCEADCDHPERLLFIDLETTGLGSATVFLIGVLAWEEGDWVVRQYLARDYSEERAITSLFAEHAAGQPLLVSFNGKSFDLPFLRMRAAAHRVSLPQAPAHLDLLHECRRAWRDQLPDCRLQTLERVFCGRTRHGDIPGAEIPEAYHRFVRTGHAAELARIIEHNRLDLVTLAELLLRLPAPE